MVAPSAIPSTLPSADPNDISAKNPNAYQSPAGLCLRLSRRAKRPLYETIGSLSGHSCFAFEMTNQPRSQGLSSYRPLGRATGDGNMRDQLL